MKEEYLLSCPLEATNEPFAVAKIEAIKMCRYFKNQYGTNFISVMLNNLYGANDNFDLKKSHVLPALIRKVHEAKLNNKPFIEYGVQEILEESFSLWMIWPIHVFF